MSFYDAPWEWPDDLDEEEREREAEIFRVEREVLLEERARQLAPVVLEV
jgi:hypothetical protein